MSRYYDPKAGSFISQDSYKGEGDAFWHLYAYCDGDPVNYVDKMGNVKSRVKFKSSKKTITKSASKLFKAFSNLGEVLQLTFFRIKVKMTLKAKTISTKQCVAYYLQLHYSIEKSIFRHDNYCTFNVNSLSIGGTRINPNSYSKRPQMYEYSSTYYLKYLTFDNISKTIYRKGDMRVEFRFYFYKTASDYSYVTPAPEFKLKYNI